MEAQVQAIVGNNPHWHSSSSSSYRSFPFTLTGQSDINIPQTYTHSPLPPLMTCSAVDTAAHFVNRQGLRSEAPSVTTTSQLRCSEYQSRRGNSYRPGRNSFNLCAVLNAGHNTDEPWPGFMFETAG